MWTDLEEVDSLCGHTSCEDYTCSVCGMSWSLYCPRLCVGLSLRCFACDKATKDICGNCEIHHDVKCFAVRAFPSFPPAGIDLDFCSHTVPTRKRVTVGFPSSRSQRSISWLRFELPSGVSAKPHG